MQANHFKSPESDVRKIEPPSKLFLYVVAVLNVLQLIIYFVGMSGQLLMVRMGVMPLPALLLDSIANILLVIGTVILIKKNKGETFYLISGIILLIAANFARNLPVSPLIPPSIYMTEIVVSFYGWQVIYRYRKRLLKFQGKSSQGV